MTVWQVRGGSNGKERAGWKTMRLDEVFLAVEIDEKSGAPRDGYVGEAKPFRRIICQLQAATIAGEQADMRRAVGPLSTGSQ